MKILTLVCWFIGHRLQGWIWVHKEKKTRYCGRCSRQIKITDNTN